MPSNSPRITGPTLKVLRELLTRPQAELSGAEIAKSTGLASGTLYPILFRLEKSGWLASHWEEVEASEVKRPRRRLYRLTGLGMSASKATFRDHFPGTGELAWEF
jgi:DNA-binding PadR family transcriptional regulator